jgi:hypothetical protein
MKFKHAVTAAAILGGVVPVGFFAASRNGLYFFGRTWDLIFWPSSLLLMGEARAPESVISYSFLLSLTANIVYYVTCLTLVWIVVLMGRTLLKSGKKEEKRISQD